MLKDFDMMTEMPVVDTRYRIMNDEEKNTDFKKQKLFINLRLNKDGKDKREVSTNQEQEITTQNTSNNNELSNLDELLRFFSIRLDNVKGTYSIMQFK